jgi:preprotein translocase subunit SecA
VQKQEGPAKRVQSWLQRKCTPAGGENVSLTKQAGVKMDVPARASFCWQVWRHLLTKNKSADEENLLTKSAYKNKICWQQKSAAENKICWQETSSDKICLRKENLLVMENSWRIRIHTTRYLRQKCVSSSGSAYSPKINYVYETSDRRNLLTESVDKKEIAYLRNLLTESADKKKNCWRQKSADGICWQKTNLLMIKICWRNLLTKIESADNEKTLPARWINSTAKKFASRQPATGWRGHFKRLK